MNKPLSFLVIAALSVTLAAAQQSSKGQPSKQPTAGKHTPQAKTQQEYKDYNAAYATNGGAAMEKAANDFAAKYPQSELTVYLFEKAMHDYQTENNPAKIVSVGEKVLQLAPDDSIALVLTATVLSDSLSDADTDRDQKIAEIRKNSNRALETIDSSFTPPTNASAEQIAAYKDTLRSMSHSALGIMDLKTGDDAGAEKELQSAADLNKTQPDPYIWYHLALAQDHQKKYAQALVSVKQALQYTGSNPELGSLAQGERDRLEKLAGATPPNTGKLPQ
jgi:tetratricopeptide (TPR) repeat protein